MAYVAIVALDGNRVAKGLSFDIQADADAHVAEHGGFVFHNTGGWKPRDMWVVGTTVTESPVGVSADAVKSEASRVILDLLPDWKQRNFIARGTELIRKVQLGGTLTQGELDEETAMQALWTKVKAVRAKSDELEALSPIPTDYAAQLAAAAS